MFWLGMPLSTAVNNLDVLGVAVANTTLHAPSTAEQADFPGHTIGQINNIILGVTTAAGREMWLGLTTLQRKDR